MLLCNLTGLAFSTTKISAGRNSSALAGAPVVYFKSVKIFLQHCTIRSNFSCGVWNASIATNSVIAPYTKSRTSAFTSSIRQPKCFALRKASCLIRLCIKTSHCSSLVKGGENRYL